MALKESIRKMEKEKAYIRRYGLKYNINTDADIIEWLGKQPSMQGYIKNLIREDIARHQAESSNATESFQIEGWIVNEQE